MNVPESPATRKPGKKGLGQLLKKFKTTSRKASATPESRSMPAHDTTIPACNTYSLDAAQSQPHVVLDIPQDLQASTEPDSMQDPVGSPAVLEADGIGGGYDRTLALIAKHNLDLEQPTRPRQPRIPYERVERPIRMRVRYTCHRCRTTFGRDRECGSCRHHRCTKCDRYPSKKPRPSEPTVEPSAPEEAIAADAEPAPAPGTCTCHECQTGIDIGIENCPNCHHKICDRCLQESTHAEEHGQGQPDLSTTTGLSEEEKIPPEGIGSNEEQHMTLTDTR